jgi:N-acetylmuramoyl-L-alanine amidase
MKKASARTSSTIPVALALALSVCVPVAHAADRVTKIQFWSMGTSTRISVEISSEFTFKHARLYNPGRIFFDIPNTTFNIEGQTRGLYQLPVSDKLVRQVRVANQSATQTRVVVDLEDDANYTASQLQNPYRLVIEVTPIAGKTPVAPAETPSVTATVEAPPAARDAREKPAEAAPLPVATQSAVVKTPPRQFVPPVVVAKKRRKVDPPSPFDAPPRMPLRVASLPRNMANPTLPRAARDPDPPPAKDPPVREAPVTVAAVPARTPASATAPPALATPANPNSTGGRSLTRELGLKLNRIVIDPGHGAHDHGTTGPTGLREKDLVLDLAMRVGKLVEDRIGAEVIYTRESDVFIPLEERPQIANQRHADLFLSIHANSSTIASVTGVETYYLNTANSRQASEVAARENAASKMSIADLEQIVQKITFNEKLKESMEFAGKMQAAMVTGTGAAGKARNRGVRRAPFIVLIGAKMPAILAEVGFLSNPEEEELMKTDAYRDKLAEALVKGIQAYERSLSHFQVAGRPGGSAAPKADAPSVISTSSSGKRTVAARARRSGASN